MKRHTIKNHWLEQAQHFSSPHYDERPQAEDINLLVIHCISLPEGNYGTPYVHDLFMGQLDCQAHHDFEPLQGLRVSAHLVIRRNGDIEQYVPFDRRAWHAGQSCFAGRERCNDYSIGIELEGTDKTPYTEPQYQQLCAVTEALMANYPGITSDRIVGHEDIAPGRKTDPGRGFDWTHYRRQLACV